MKLPHELRLTLLLVVILLVGYACQDTILSEDELVDEDMIAATEMVDDLSAAVIENEGWSENERRSWTRTSITVLRYQDGILLYNTNKDDVSGYQPVTEETVTAMIEPGEIVFWYKGGGLAELNDIEFDELSEVQLNNLPYCILEDRLWYVRIPENVSSDELKYDILYTSSGSNDVVRLDPKIEIVPAE